MYRRFGKGTCRSLLRECPSAYKHVYSVCPRYAVFVEAMQPDLWRNPGYENREHLSLRFELFCCKFNSKTGLVSVLISVFVQRSRRRSCQRCHQRSHQRSRQRFRHRSCLAFSSPFWDFQRFRHRLVTDINVQKVSNSILVHASKYLVEICFCDTVRC